MAPVPWEALHLDWDQHLERDADYWYAIERVDTLAKVIERTAHLMSKRRLPDTNWNHLLGIVAAAEREA